MFTGIVQEIGKIKDIIVAQDYTKITIEAKKVVKDLNVGESVAVNGVCLTVTEIGEKSFSADIMPETLKVTNLVMLKRGAHVNLERALRVQERMNGHIVQGHIDTTGKIIDIRKEKNAIILKMKCEQSLLRYIVPKGAIAVDGVSLTVVDADSISSWFTVSIAPYTLENTIIRYYSIGTIINIECDIIAKYVERMLYKIGTEKREASAELSLEFLRDNGFLR